MNIRHFIIGCLIVGLMLLLWAKAEGALAHAILVSADPEPNSIVSTAPEEVWLLFSEPVEPSFSSIVVSTPSGQPIDTGSLTPANENNTAFIVSLPPLLEGTYVVRWQVLSTVDGHATSGAFPFGVGVGQIATEVGPASFVAQEPTVFSVAGRWLSLTGVTLLLGLFTFHLFVWQPLCTAVRPDEFETQLRLTFERQSLKVGGLALALLGLGLLSTFISQASQFDLFSDDHARLWLGTRFGSMWFLRSGLALVGVIHVVYLYKGVAPTDSHKSGWAWWAGLALSAGLALTISLASHSAALTANDATLAFFADFSHILAAGMWVGGLLQLGLVLWLVRRLPAKSRGWLNWGLALNFSTLSAGAVGVLLVSGGYLAWRHIGNWTLLFGTAYGLTLLAKIGLALPAFGIAAFNLLIMKPRLEATFDNPESKAALLTQRRFGRLVYVEIGSVLLVLAAAGYLTDLQQGQDAPLLADQPGRVSLEQMADDLSVTLGLEPALVGQNQFDVFLTDTQGQAVEDAEDVSLRFTSLGQAMGTSTVQATHTGAGHYQAEGGYVSLVGPWRVEVAIRRLDAVDVFAPFRMEAGLSGVIRPSGDQRILEQLANFLTQSGAAVTGILLIFSAAGWGFIVTRAAKHDWQLALLLLPGFIAFWIGGLQVYTFFNEFTPAKFATNPVLPDSGSISQGEQLYNANCLACHGPAGRGDGPAALNLLPPPPDFTSGHTDSHPDGDVYYWIKEGVPNTTMPAFGEQLSDKDLWNLVNYVRRLSAQQ